MPLNLIQQRSGPSVWDRTNVRQNWDFERWLASMMAGGLFIAGIRRRSAVGWLMAAAGGALGLWATCSPESRQLHRGQFCAAWPWGRDTSDRVIEASEESFPASDAPSWTPTTSTQTRARYQTSVARPQGEGG